MCATGAGAGADVGPTMTLHRIGNERQPVVVIDDFAADPNALRAAIPAYPRLAQLHDAVFARPRIRRYLASPRRHAFSTEGIFRHYRALDS